MALGCLELWLVQLRDWSFNLIHLKWPHMTCDYHTGQHRIADTDFHSRVTTVYQTETLKFHLCTHSLAENILLLNWRMSVGPKPAVWWVFRVQHPVPWGNWSVVTPEWNITYLGNNLQGRVPEKISHWEWFIWDQNKFFRKGRCPYNQVGIWV